MTEIRLVLAPMEGVTDFSMRSILTEMTRFSWCVSEFIRVSHCVPPDHVLIDYVPELNSGAKTNSGIRTIPQILGGNSELMAETALRLCELGADGVDINFGCPAPTVNRHDGGATLLKYPNRIREIVSAVKRAVPKGKSVSAKLRLGWDTTDAIFLNSEMCADAGADWITIHGRTRIAGYTPPAFWRPISKVKRDLKIPVFANGEIWNREDLARCQDDSECSDFMIGRGVLADPLFANKLLGGPAVFSSWPQIINRFVEISFQNGSSEKQILARCKQWLNYAFKRGNFPEFEQVKRLTAVKDLISALPVKDL